MFNIVISCFFFPLTLSLCVSNSFRPAIFFSSVSKCQLASSQSHLCLVNLYLFEYLGLSLVSLCHVPFDLMCLWFSLLFCPFILSFLSLFFYIPLEPRFRPLLSSSAVWTGSQSQASLKDWCPTHTSKSWQQKFCPQSSRRVMCNL